MLLFLTSEVYHSHAEWLAAECQRRAVPYLCLYTEQFPSQAVVTIQPHQGQPRGWLHLPEDEASVATITGVWCYLPGASKVDPELDAVASLLIQQEADETLRGLSRALENRRWINLPHKVRAAEHKIFQLRLAAQVGFATPKSIVTNDPRQAVSFLQTCGGQMVYKPRHPLLQLDANGYPTGGVFVTLVTQRELEAYLDSIALAPCLFQEVVPKLQELTVYVIGSHVWAAAVRSKCEVGEHAIDYRIYGLENCHYTPALLPPAIEKICLAMTRQLGLGMCNFDLIQTPAGDYVFLDANPTEQWNYVEQVTGFPFCATIVDELLEVTP